MIWLSFRGINPQALHLAFTTYTILAHAQDTSEEDLPDLYALITSPKSFSFKEKFTTVERRCIHQLLRYTHGGVVDPKERNQAIQLDTFLHFCQLIDVHPLQVLTLPTTYIRSARGHPKDIPVPLSAVSRSWGR